MPKCVLVTGGAGFIGSHLVDRLLMQGWRVCVVDNFDPFYEPAVKWENVRPHLVNSTFSLVQADICDYQELRKRLRGTYDVIVHFAAKAGVRPSIQDPLTYHDVNVRGTLNLLELTREWGVKQFVFASSSSVYGTNPNVPWREDDQVLQPISPYAATKVSAELLGRVYSHLYGIRFIALRFFTVYGPRQRPDLAIHKFARQMLENQPIAVYGHGQTCRDYTYIADIIDGICAAIDYHATLYEIINLGNNRTVGLLELIRALEEVLGLRATLNFVDDQAGDVPQTWADLEKAGRLLDYAPSFKLGDGLRVFADWLMSGREAAARRRGQPLRLNE